MDYSDRQGVHASFIFTRIYSQVPAFYTELSMSYARGHRPAQRHGAGALHPARPTAPQILARRNRHPPRRPRRSPPPLSLRAHRRHQRQRLHRRHARLHPPPPASAPASILRRTSSRVNERIRIGGAEISDDAFAASTSASTTPPGSLSSMASLPSCRASSKPSPPWPSSTSPRPRSRSPSSKSAWAAVSTPPTSSIRSSPSSPTSPSTTPSGSAPPSPPSPARRPASSAPRHPHHPAPAPRGQPGPRRSRHRARRPRRQRRRLHAADRCRARQVPITVQVLGSPIQVDSPLTAPTSTATSPSPSPPPSSSPPTTASPSLPHHRAGNSPYTLARPP